MNKIKNKYKNLSASRSHNQVDFKVSNSLKKRSHRPIINLITPLYSTKKI